MLKRPNVNDDDEEILRQQEEFFKQQNEKKIIPAAKIIKTSKDLPNPIPSANTTFNNDSQEKMDIDSQENIQDQIANTFEAIPTNMKLNQISERHTGTKSIQSLKFDTGGFPKAVRRDPDIKPKKGSIFSQHIKRIKKDVDPHSDSFREMMESEMLVVREKDVHGDIKVSHTPSSTYLEGIATAAQRSNVLSISDRQLIHNENVQKLKSMTEEEIYAEREKLMTMLDPSLIQFLKSQRSAAKEDVQNRNETIEAQNEAAAEVSLDELEVPKELLSAPEAAGWLNFNTFEAHKMAWMRDVPLSDLKKNEGFEARFDFDGYLLPYCVAEIDDSNRHLYHHGQEPQRPGYSLQELLLLTRSTVIQQRVTALNALANLLGLEQTGIYDKVIDFPLEQIFFVLRVCLDDNTPSVLTAAIKALRNLVYFQIDETCLDNMMNFGIGMVQPTLAVDDDNDDNTVNDQQLAETNLVKCLLRTQILVRIRYIVNTVKPPAKTIIYCIELLIRLSRDSDFIISKLLECEGLLSCLIKYFLPNTIEIGRNKENPGYYMPLPQMVKLIKVLSCRSKSIAESLLKKHDLFEVIVKYLYEEYFSQNAFGMHLQVECMRYWTVLFHYGLISESINQHESVLFKILDYHFKNTDNTLTSTLIRQSHLSALIILIATFREKGHNVFPCLMQDGFKKWIHQFSDFKEFRCGHSQIVSALFHYAAICNQTGINLYHTNQIENFIASRGFVSASSEVLFGSLITQNYGTHQTSANLKSLEAATGSFSNQIVPVFHTKSCLPFLYAFSTCILSDPSKELKTNFLYSPLIKQYVEVIRETKKYFNGGNWFTRIESFFIMNILKIAQQIPNRLASEIFYEVAVKCLSIFSADQKRDIQFIFKNIIFDQRFYSLEVSLQMVTVESKTELTRAWNHIHDIDSVYAHILGITNKLITFTTSLSMDSNLTSIIPIDWIYAPIVMLYGKEQNRPSVEPITNEWLDFDVMMACLRWLLIYETHFPELAQIIDPAVKYVRLGCLFLCNDSLFLHTEMQDLLTEVYKFLVKKQHVINFEKPIAGLTSFKDFYVQLLEQYQACSYGNKVFGNVLLFPLAKKHDVKYRKTLWSEYIGVVETFAVQPSEVWINGSELLWPVDTDRSLCMAYYQAMNQGQIPENSIMYEIAEQSIQAYKERLDRQRRAGMSNGCQSHGAAAHE